MPARTFRLFSLPFVMFILPASLSLCVWGPSTEPAPEGLSQKQNEGSENFLNAYTSPSGTRIKRGCLRLLRQPQQVTAISFVDERIYVELEKDTIERSTPMHCIISEQAAALFIEWEEKVNKN
jgi:hypothetical protein